jgi:hypothetical protein
VSRVGQSYLIDHGSGRSSLRLVVAQQGEGWQLAVFQPEEHYVAYFDEPTLELWESRSREGVGNVRRVG